MIEIEIEKKEEKLKEHRLKDLDVGTVLKMENGVYAVCVMANIFHSDYCEDNKCLIVLNRPLDNEICLATGYFQNFKSGRYEVIGKIKSGSKLIVE